LDRDEVIERARNAGLGAHGVFAPNHAWREFVVLGPTKKRTCPAHDEPNDSNPPPTCKPSTGRAPAEFWKLLRATVLCTICKRRCSRCWLRESATSWQSDSDKS
jgi:hypothetical protein